MPDHDFLKQIPAAPQPEGVDPATGLVSGSFGIGTFRTGADAAFPGIVVPGGAVFSMSDRYRDTHAVFDDWGRAVDWANEVAHRQDRQAFTYDALEILPVLSHPNILGAGSNYRQHVAEMMTFNKFNQHARKEGEGDEAFFHRNLAEIDRRGREGMPFFWTGLHSALCGANDDVPLPLIGKHPDWELEFGVIVGKTGRYIRPDEADDLIAAYVMVNDLGTVDEFRRVDVRFQYDWVSKNQPNFKPFGPFAVPKQFVDRSKVQIRLSVNGAVRQDWPISDMIFQPEQILSYATERIRLLPGDLLITGSPPGNAAMHGNAWLKPGDIVESEITYLGRQRNQVVAEDAGGRAPTYGPFITEW
ncbi:fumarylacetoacetate hydrolase family protein [Nitrospirillum iridis]|uniref:2-keto-4-pentenoate hydratase/2-oxohepta-3-ene-1,7-dioic acid hydratase in catechol pathway n=1 Tax=Nitrospirillum iridis TaxID=765888 RepID=A0A7X0B461_9PROT|nr:fumarylacetoacetate hydrolase family protein [Nitrospirillum iridis]MBB6255395.1 2-keto-4-pentenoate hydratase/2-oxohepta-3-ene-1,7-dioic acid hydratase in catechol pathway [Nitrospirillum iridis]